MFLANAPIDTKEQQLRSYLAKDASIAIVIAASYFEWMVSRAVMFLSETPNKVLRERMAKVYGLDGYKELWKEEVVRYRSVAPLAEVCRDWSAVRDAFRTRNLVVHGRDRCTRNMATPHVEALICACRRIRDSCTKEGFAFERRLPVRRRSK